MSERVQPRDDLRALDGYHSPQLDVAVRLNTNESPYPPPDAFITRWTDRLRAVDYHRYPDRSADELRAALGGFLGQPPARLFCANGSNEVLQTLLLTYGGHGRSGSDLRADVCIACAHRTAHRDRNGRGGARARLLRRRRCSSAADRVGAPGGRVRVQPEQPDGNGRPTRNGHAPRGCGRRRRRVARRRRGVRRVRTLVRVGTCRRVAPARRRTHVFEGVVARGDPPRFRRRPRVGDCGVGEGRIAVCAVGPHAGCGNGRARSSAPRWNNGSRRWSKSGAASSPPSPTTRALIVYPSGANFLLVRVEGDDGVRGSGTLGTPRRARRPRPQLFVVAAGRGMRSGDRWFARRERRVPRRARNRAPGGSPVMSERNAAGFPGR